MAALFTVLTGMALIWSIVTYFRVYNAVREHLPPQFQDDESSRYAFSVWALRHPTPLPVQAEYVRFVKGSNAAILCGALASLSSGQPVLMVLGSVWLAAFLYGVFSAIRCSRIYEQNCKRAEAQNDGQNQ
ncbi:MULTISPECIES: hypothetical protein [unclassified Bradyrhizobium]